MVVILIACLVKREDDLEIYGGYLDIAELREVLLVLVNVVCDPETKTSRLGSEKRRGGGKAKLVDGDVLEKIRSETRLLDRETVLDFGKREGGKVLNFEVGKTPLTVEDSTEILLQRLLETDTEGVNEK